MTPKGYVLIEALTAAILLSLAAAGLHTGISQGIRAEAKIRRANAVTDPARLVFLRLESDLRNAVPVRNHKFAGDFSELSFAAHLPNLRLVTVKYFLKSNEIIREESSLQDNAARSKASSRTLARKIAFARIEYAFLDDEEKFFFDEEWPEEPYLGIPKAIKITLRFKGSEETFSKLIWIPQGQWAQRTVE